jgi:hypothetical protein
MACSCSPNQKYRFTKIGNGDLQSTESLHFRSDAIKSSNSLHQIKKSSLSLRSLLPLGSSKKGEANQLRGSDRHPTPLLCTSLYIPSPLRFAWFLHQASGLGPPPRLPFPPVRVRIRAASQPPAHRSIDILLLTCSQFRSIDRAPLVLCAVSSCRWVVANDDEELIDPSPPADRPPDGQ